MGVVIPQVVTEDRASEAQFIDGSLRFDSSKSHYFIRTPGSAGNRRTWTWSGWVKRNTLGYQVINFAGVNSSGNGVSYCYFNSDNTLYFFGGVNAVSNDYSLITTQVFRDTNAWLHIVCVFDSTNATSTDRLRLYINGSRVTAFGSASYPTQNYQSAFNNNVAHYIGGGYAGGAYLNSYATNTYFIDGQALDASPFGYTDPLTNTWRPKTYTGTYGTNGFYLPMDGNTPIGQDRSGNNNNWTPVNFGGSNTIEKATGALPILNTDGGGKVARVGVRTDSNASSLVLALPLVGIRSDFSNTINSGVSNKTVTVTGNAAASSARSNFYGGSFVFDGSGDYLDTGYSVNSAFAQGDYTIEFWFYSNDDQNEKGLFGMLGGQYGISMRHFGSYSADGNKTLKAHFGSAALSVGITNRVQDRWVHVAMVKSGTTGTLYVDGVNQGTVSTGSPTVSTTNLCVGTYYDTSYSFNGYIQDFRVYTTAKYTSNFIPASTDPDIVPDSPSGVSYSSNVALVPSTDGAVAFDGSGDYLSTADSVDYPSGTEDFTYEAFVYLTANAGGNQYVLGKGGSGVAEQIALLHNGTSWVTYIANSGGTLFLNGVTWGNASLNMWHHISICRSGNNFYGSDNGVVTLLGTSSASVLDNAALFAIGGFTSTTTVSGTPITGFISNVHIVKGTALYTSNFTPPSAPISSVANTKLLCCKSNSSATAADVTPGTITANGNAAASNFNPFTANINTQRGKQSGYATLNPLDVAGGTAFSLSNGNLNGTFTNGGQTAIITASVYVSSGKWYAEFIPIVLGASSGTRIGIQKNVLPRTYLGGDANNYAYQFGGNKQNNTSSVSYGASYTTNDVISVLLDMDNGTITFWKNGITQGQAYSGLSGEYTFAYTDFGSGSFVVNFGQKPFKFPPPPGFQPLTLANTPRPTIVRPDQFVGIVTYKGNGSALAVNVGFQPDFVWCKIRTPNAYNHTLLDSVRGFTKSLSSSMTVQEYTEPTGPVAITRTGFTLNGDVTYVGSVNQNNSDYVAWCWKAGGNSNTFNINDIGYSTASAAGLTAGTITPTGASISTKSGFSILTYTGTGSGSITLSHGLGKAPDMYIVKDRTFSGGRNWIVYHKSLGASSGVVLNSTNGASGTDPNWWNSTSPTSSVLSVGTYGNEAQNYIVYAWTEIPGFSKFGSYTGNGSVDGTVVITGFRPRFILTKRTDSTSNWILHDTTRSPNNVAQNILFADLSAQENGFGVFNVMDILSNGFKFRLTGDPNSSGGTYIYAAFAEVPTINLYGAQANAR